MTQRRTRATGEAGRFGAQLSAWRAARRRSQLDLSLEAGLSQRHLSFLESGRSSPSREAIAKLCEALDLPLRARNELMQSAGYAAAYRERELSEPEMASAREAIRRVIAHHEPFPAFVVDREWRVLMSNAGAALLVAACVDEATLRSISSDGRLNFMRLMFEPLRMRPRILNWSDVAPRLLARLDREARGDPNSSYAALRRELVGSLDAAWAPHAVGGRELPFVPVTLDVEGATIRLFNTITTFGTPQDVGLQELHIEMSYPLDAATARFFESAAEARRVGGEPGEAGEKWAFGNAPTFTSSDGSTTSTSMTTATSRSR